MKVLAILVSIVAVFAQSNALTLGSFSNVTGGVWDAWNRNNPENVKPNTNLGFQYGNGKLWLISHRMHRQGFEDPWDSAVRGGIVSTLNLSTKQWVHSPYDRIDEDKRGDKLFSLHGRLFMLSYSIAQPTKIKFHKLFFWNDETKKWVEVPFEIDATATTNPNNGLSTHSIATLTVSVPKPDETTAYIVASAHGRATGGGEFAFSKLDLEFRGNVPTKATLKSLKHEVVPHPSAVSFVAFKNDKLYAFYQTFLSEGYQPESMHAYTLDLKTKTVANVTMSGTAPPMGFSRVHQTDNQVILVGGTQAYGLGQIRDVQDIYALNLSTLQWQNTGSKIPTNAGKTSVYAPDQKKLYLVGLKEGVQQAQVTSN